MRQDLWVEMVLKSGDGTRLVARRSGRGQPMVLVHGSAGGLDSWDPVVPLLADDFEVWVYARRGYLPSGGCERPKTFADDVADLRAVLAAAGGTAHVVGASYGATVALHAAREARTVTVFEPPLYAAGAAVAGPLDRYRELLAVGALPEAKRVFAVEVARAPAVIAAALSMDGAAPGTDETGGILHDLEALAADSADIARWAGIGVPVRIVQGADTWAPMPETMDALAAALPDAERVTLPGQSHFATHTAPEMFAAAVRR